MALELKRKSKQYLKSQRVTIEDRSPLSEEYFGISDFPKYFGEGKNSFRIRPRFGSLKPNTKIDIEIIDANGNPIYWEVPTYKDNDKSRLVSVWVYDISDRKYNTPDGPCEVIIVGTLPDDQKIRWSRRVDVVKNKKSVSEVVFKQLPKGFVSSSIEVFSDIPQTDGSLTQTIQSGQFTYKKSIYGDDVSFEASSAIINGEMISGSLELDLSSTTLYPRLGGGQSQPTRVTASITEVVSNTILRVSLPITASDSRNVGSIHTYEYSDGTISGDIKYLSTGSLVTTQNQVAIANITLTNVKPISGRVSSVNTLIKSQGLANSDFELIANTDVPNNETISYKVAIPTEQLNDPKTLKVQFLNKSGDVSNTEILIKDVIFEGGNVYIGGTQSIVTGSFHIGNAIGTGIEMAGHSSGYLKSVGYNGFTSASLGKGPGGFLLFSGSGNLVVGEDTYNGVGLDLVANSESYFRYTTQGGGNLDIRTDSFFIGSPDLQFISGADSNIEISSSLFHLDPQNDSLVIGANATILADLTANEIRTPAQIGGVQSTRTNASSSIDSDGFARFVSASIGGFDISDNQINSTNDLLILKSNGQITASAANIDGDIVTDNITATGGTIGGFELGSSIISSSNANLVLKSNGQITGSQVLFDGGTIGGFELGSDIISSSNGNLVLNSNGQITGSQVLFNGGVLGGFGITNNVISSSNDALILKANGQITGSAVRMIVDISGTDYEVLDTTKGIIDAKNVGRSLYFNADEVNISRAGSSSGTTYATPIYVVWQGFSYETRVNVSFQGMIHKSGTHRGLGGIKATLQTAGSGSSTSNDNFYDNWTTLRTITNIGNIGAIGISSEYTGSASKVSGDAYTFEIDDYVDGFTTYNHAQYQPQLFRLKLEPFAQVGFTGTGQSNVFVKNISVWTSRGLASTFNLSPEVPDFGGGFGI